MPVPVELASDQELEQAIRTLEAKIKHEFKLTQAEAMYLDQAITELNRRKGICQ